MLLLVAATMLMVSCSKDNEDLIVGTWKTTSCTWTDDYNNLAIWRYAANGDFEFQYHGETMYGFYTIDGDELTMTIDNDPETVTITDISATTMTWKMKRGNMTLRKI